jgi:predicted transcriptional regulator
MRKNYDFSQARRGPIVQQPAKTRVSIDLDNELLERLRECADAAGRGYQAMINEAVREYLARLERRPPGAACGAQVISGSELITQDKRCSPGG